MMIGSCPLDGRIILWRESLLGVTRHRCSTESKGLWGASSSCTRDECGADFSIARGRKTGAAFGVSTSWQRKTSSSGKKVPVRTSQKRGGMDMPRSPAREAEAAAAEAAERHLLHLERRVKRERETTDPYPGGV